MWWNKAYVNKRDWLLENMVTLGLTSDQMIVLMMIDYGNVNNLEISQDLLMSMTGFNNERLNMIISSLTQMKYLKVSVINGQVVFNLDGLFEENIDYRNVSETIFDSFELEFGRTLSQKELMKLNEWFEVYSHEEILEALKRAVVYQKRSMSYIETILMNMRNEIKNEN